MRFASLGSGSEGNALVVSLPRDEGFLLVDCGFALKEVARRLARLQLELSGLRAILVTHEHGDHYDAPTLEAIAGDAPLIVNPAVYDLLPEALKANATAMANGDAGEVTGLPIEAVPAHNTTADRMQYHPEGRDNGYVLTLGDKRVYIAGDTEPTEAMLALTDIAVAFLPMNLPYTMTPEQAAEAINTFKPKIVYPYHYGESDLSVLEGAVDEGVEVRLLEWYPNGQG